MNRQNPPTLNQPGTHLSAQAIQDNIASLRAQITREHKMLTWAKTTLAEGGTKKNYITRRQSAINKSRAQLGWLVGQQQANSIMQQIMMQTTPTTEPSNDTKPLQ